MEWVGTTWTIRDSLFRFNPSIWMILLYKSFIASEEKFFPKKTQVGNSNKENLAYSIHSISDPLVPL